MSKKNFLSSLYKNESIYSEERSQVEGIERVQLTSMPYLNYAIGGGLPVGYLIQHAGATQAGKSFVSFIEAKHWQEHFGDNSFVLIADFEHTTTIGRCKQFGLDTSKDKLLIWKQADNSGSAFFDFLLDDFLPGCKEAGIKPFIILDSKDCMLPPGELGRKAAEMEMGAMAKFLKRVLKRTVAQLSETQGTMVIINQLVMKIGQLWGNPETTSGGNALKHNSVLDIWFKKVEKKEEQIFNENNQKIGHKITFKIDKNKVGNPNKVGFIKINYDGKVVDTEEEVLEMVKTLKVVQRPNNRTYTLDKDRTWTSKGDFLNAIANVPGLKEELLTLCANVDDFNTVIEPLKDDIEELSDEVDGLE